MKLGLDATQRAERRKWIGGSDAPAIVAGGNEWRKLWRVKTGRDEEEDLTGVLRVQMGAFTEPFNCFWYEKQTGRKVERRSEVAALTTSGGAELGANLDGVTRTKGGELAYIDFKHVARAGDQLTLSYTSQGTHCAILLGLDWWISSAFVGNSKWELTEQEVDPFFAADYLAKCEEFWGYVLRDEEPPEVEPLPVPAPRKLRTVRLEDEGQVWPNWGAEFADYMEKWARTNAAHKAHMATQESIKKLMPEDVGTVTRGLIKVARDRAGAVRVSLSKGEER